MIERLDEVSEMNLWELLFVGWDGFKGYKYATGTPETQKEMRSNGWFAIRCLIYFIIASIIICNSHPSNGVVLFLDTMYLCIAALALDCLVRLRIKKALIFAIWFGIFYGVGHIPMAGWIAIGDAI